LSLRSHAIVAALVMGAIAIAIAIGVAVLAVARARRAPAISVARFAIDTSPDQPFFASGPAGQERNVAMSPDGKRIAYVVGIPAFARLIIRDLDQLDSRAIANGRQPFFSPDGGWVGFVTDTGSLVKVAVTGGSPTPVTRVTAALRGATWGADGTIVFATIGRMGLMSVPSDGGEAKEITRPDAGTHHYFPSFLPNGRAVLFTVSKSNRVDDSDIAALDLATGRPKLLLRGGSSAEYVESESAGYLIYSAAGALRAVRFEADRLELRGNPVPVLDRVMTSRTGATRYAVARNGTLVYVPGGLVGELGGEFSGAPRTVVWVNRQGQEEPLNLPARTYSIVRLSPEGKRAVFEIDDQEDDIWTADLTRIRPPLSRLTTDPDQDSRPVWTPDGRHIIFTSSRSGIQNLYWRAADGTGSDEPLTTSPDIQIASAVTPDRKLLIVEVVPGLRGELMSLDLDARAPAGATTREARNLFSSPFIENNPEPSPDGRWIAYSSDASGTNEIYVRPFPNVNDGLTQVSSGGGSRPVWRGKELFFLDHDNILTSVHVDTKGSTFSAGKAVQVLKTAYFSGTPQRPYDVTADGQRFLMIKDSSGDRAQFQPRLVVVLNWIEELKTRVR
jgi:serine/threonine-protein kinase